MPAPPTFVVDQNGDPVTRLRFECTEATAAQAAGLDGGRATAVEHLVVTASGLPTERVTAPGVNATYAIPQASLVSDAGPWTNIASSSLAVGGVAGDEVDVWVRLIIKRWGTLLNPSIDATIRVGAVEPAAIDDP